MTSPLRPDRDAMGELFIWTDIDPAHETDFNRWYDREHMAERAAIPGFLWSRRYRASTGERPYLALYRTASLGVFDSDAYRRAFSQQTAWSLANFGRMRNTSRRVMTVSLLGGVGTGGALALLRLGDTDTARRVATQAGNALRTDGVLALRLLTPDSALSTPLPSEDPATRVLEPVLLVEGTSESAAAEAARQLAHGAGLPADRVRTFQLLWDLRADDLREAAGPADHP